MPKLASVFATTIVLCLTLSPVSVDAQRVEWEQSMGSGYSAFESGNYRAAERHFGSALRVAREHFRPVDERLAQSFYSMGMVHVETGRHEKAVPYLEQAVAMGEDSLRDDPRTLSQYIQYLAAVYEELDRVEAATGSYLQALEVRERALESNDYRLAALLEKVAQLHSRQQRHGEATQYYRQAVRINESSFGPKHPILSESLIGLADSFQSQGMFDEAASLHARALAIRKRSLGPDHYLVAECLEGYAATLRGLGRDGEAGNMEAEAKSILGGKAASDMKRNELLLLSPSFQNLASQQTSTDEDQIIVCECYDRPKHPKRYTVPSDRSGGWDCPSGWSAACRIDVATKGRIFWITNGEVFTATGSSPERLYRIKRFRGELGVGGEGFPPPGYLK